jgi:hypothetical protein
MYCLMILITLFLQLKFHYPVTIVNATTTCVFLFYRERGKDRRQEVVQIVNSKFQLHPNCPSVRYFYNHNFNPTVARTHSNGCSLLPKHYRTYVYVNCFYCFGPQYSTLKFSVLISGTLYTEYGTENVLKDSIQI